MSEACGVSNGALDEVILLWWDVSPRLLAQCDIVLGRERPRRDDLEAWDQRDAPRFRDANTETRVIPSLHERAARVRQEQDECRMHSPLTAIHNLKH
jgi:hypothetical protein